MPDLAKTRPLQEVAEKGAAIYAANKNKYEADHKGRFLAIEVESGKIYEGNDSATTLEKARAAHPGKLFYVIRVGFDSAETLSHLLLKKR